jgi:hypothetical protein
VKPVLFYVADNLLFSSTIVCGMFFRRSHELT